MAKMIPFCPLGKLNLSYKFRLEPTAVRHFLGSQTFSPATLVALRKVHKRTLRSFLSPPELFKDFAARSRSKAVFRRIKNPRR